MSLRLKVCCIASVTEARLALASGANILGLVSAMPSGPGPIAEELVAEIAAQVPRPMGTWLLTSLTDADAIIAQHARCGTTGIQLTDSLEPGGLASLRKALPDVTLVQVVHVISAESVAEAVEAAPFADAVLLDSGNPNLAVKELGGTGRVHDWSLSAEIVRCCPKPVFLAGGLRPDNVRAAVATVRSAGVDLCSGVRTEGRLDAAKLAAFVAALRATA